MEMALPKEFVDFLPENLRAHALYILGGAVCIGALFVLIVFAGILRLLFGGRPQKPDDRSDLTEDLSTYPDLKSTSGDRQLRAEGTPVRLRLVVLAPAGNTEIDEDQPCSDFGRGRVRHGRHSQARQAARGWPKQVSYQGFATFFHSHTPTGAPEKSQTRWVTVAGRVQVGKKQYMLGVALQSIKPNTIGRRTVDSHEWANVLRVRVRD